MGSSEVERVVYRTCTLCEACCGIAVFVDGYRIGAIAGDADAPSCRGYVGATARALKDLHEDAVLSGVPVRVERRPSST